MRLSVILFLLTSLTLTKINALDNFEDVLNWFRKTWNKFKNFFKRKTKNGNFDCGLQDIEPYFESDKKRFKRITGGQSSRWHSWPWVVSIFSSKTLKTCCGTLISEDMILTAAHCVRYEKISDLKVAVGVHSVLGKINPINYCRVKRKYIYDRYRDLCHGDLAILQLSSKLNRTSKINTICLPSTKIDLENRDAVVVGWGVQSVKTKWYSTGSLTLRQGEVTIIPDEVCAESYSGFDSHDEICAYNDKSNVDTRAGDSGGPLMVKINDRWTIVGITSHGIDTNPVKPGFYSRVYEKMDFILKHVKI